MSSDSKKLPLRRNAIAWLWVFTLLSGCAVGPNYKRPVIDSPATFRGETAAGETSFGDLDWWTVYEDPILQSLVREAITNNYDLLIATARVEQERALAVQARSQFFPNLEYNGIITRGRNELLGSLFPNNGVTASSALVSLNTFWELDLWGRIRRLNEAARARALASEDARNGVMLTLLSDVASDYFRLMELDGELEIDARTTNSFGDSLNIFRQRMEGGTGSALETSRAEAAMADAESATPFVLQEIALTENELSILLGRNPGPIGRSKPDISGQLTPNVPVGLPSQLLQRRPDIRQAEQLLRAANADVGESVAEFFPKIGLTALLGRVSPELSAFSLGSANAWGVAAQTTGPIFEGGKLVGQYHQTKAAKEEAILRYRQSILVALRDVSDALISRQRLAEIRGHQATEVASLEKAVKLATERYLAGKANYYEVLEAQQQLFPAQLNLARTQRDQQLVIVTLYKSLGGGWKEAPSK